MLPLDLDDRAGGLSENIFNEIFFRSGDGHSFLQRLMIFGEPENLHLISTILKENPNSLYTFNRRLSEHSFDTALRINKPRLLKLLILCVVNGTLDPKRDHEISFLSFDIPKKCRESLLDIVVNYPASYIVEILNAMSFMKVPFTEPRAVETGDRVECISKFYTDPWHISKTASRKLHLKHSSSKVITRRGTMRTPAVLPIPGLGDMGFLRSLLVHAPTEAFNNDAIALALRVLWEDHIRKYFYLDCVVFLILRRLDNAYRSSGNIGARAPLWRSTHLEFESVHRYDVQHNFYRERTHRKSLWRTTRILEIHLELV
jgi:hypothetical protein